MYSEKNTGYAGRLGILALVFLATLFLATFLMSLIGADSPSSLMGGAALQDIVVFCGSAWVMARYCSDSPLHFLKATTPVKGKALLGILLFIVIGLPFMNQLIWWNSNMSLPDSMSAIERSFRMMEDNAAATTELMLSGTSVGSLIAGVLIVGVLTGISEEIFFRGALQKILCQGIGPYGAIWVAAFIFSLLHFQFFGFVPRLLLGAFFGYLFLWTRSIWASAFAHAVNNSIVVITMWLSNRGVITEVADDFGICKDGFPWPWLASLILLAVAFRWGRKFFFSSSNQGVLNYGKENC